MGSSSAFRVEILIRFFIHHGFNSDWSTFPAYTFFTVTYMRKKIIKNECMKFVSLKFHIANNNARRTNLPRLLIFFLKLQLNLSPPNLKMCAKLISPDGSLTHVVFKFVSWYSFVSPPMIF